MDQTITVEILFACQLVIFLCAVFMHLIRGNASLIAVYVMQSIAVAVGIFSFALEENAWGLMLSAFLTVGVKVIIAPVYFFRLVKRRHLKFSGTTYISTPGTLFIIAILSLIADFVLSSPLAAIAPEAKHLIFLSMASILTSLFLTVNRKGALSQIIGILAFENSIVSFASSIGLKHTIGLELGIAFDIAVWVIIASVFLSLLYKHFKSLDVSEMHRLKE